MPSPPHMPETIRIFLLSNHPVIRRALRLLIESQCHLCVIGEAPCEDAVAAACQRPDVLLVDCEPAHENWRELLPSVLAAAPGLRVLVLTGERNPDFHSGLLRSGVFGVVRKADPPETLLKAIRKVHQGEIWLDRATVSRVLDQTIRPRRGSADASTEPWRCLTEREREIVSLVGEALSNKQIARRLLISHATVRHHLTSIFGKLGLSNRLELLRFALRHGLAGDRPTAGTPAWPEDAPSAQVPTGLRER
ncbi:MAG: response regulator transcription factor [Firmicutes bacterium]|nr:response regulator transcription factor [Bacillota bacterium]